jgi:hypothetical protein
VRSASVWKLVVEDGRSAASFDRGEDGGLPVGQPRLGCLIVGHRDRVAVSAYQLPKRSLDVGSHRREKQLEEPTYVPDG